MFGLKASFKRLLRTSQFKLEFKVNPNQLTPVHIYKSIERKAKTDTNRETKVLQNTTQTE